NNAFAFHKLELVTGFARKPLAIAVNAYSQTENRRLRQDLSSNTPAEYLPQRTQRNDIADLSSFLCALCALCALWLTSFKPARSPGLAGPAFPTAATSPRSAPDADRRAFACAG